MATISGALLCAVFAILIWFPLGLRIAKLLGFPSDLRCAAAPTLGWATQCLVSLIVGSICGFTVLNVVVVTIALGILAIVLKSLPSDESQRSGGLPLWVIVASAVIAVGPAMGILPKITAEGVALAPSIYDHAKIALIDEMVRSGVPPANPFLGGVSEPGSIAYYYFWLFGAAQLALLTDCRGWTADVAATWFTAFSSLVLMCGLAFRFSNARSASAFFVLAISLGGSLRPILAALMGNNRLDAVLEPPTGLGGWLFQTSWSPHHVAAGTTTVLFVVVLYWLSRQVTAVGTVILGFIVAAGFASSFWVGGITFILCATVAGLIILFATDYGRRLTLLVSMLAAAVIVVFIVFPLLSAQLHSAGERGAGFPITLMPFPVLGPAIPANLRVLLDPLAYWLILLPIQFPLIWPIGAIATFRLRLTTDTLVAPLAGAALASFTVGAFFMSTVGENNDLGWRAIIPGILIFTAISACYLTKVLRRGEIVPAGAMVACLILSIPEGAALVKVNMVGHLSSDAAAFQQAPALWDAIRAKTSPDERVASNPRMTNALVPWPISLSWALLADRRSCFSGAELVLAFTALPSIERKALTEFFDHVYSGAASDADVRLLAGKFNCKAVVLTPQDGAWANDPFAASPLFKMVEESKGQWRIYRVFEK